MWKRYLEVGIDAGFSGGAYYFFGWVGFGVWAMFLFGWYATQMISNQRIMMQTLLSRLPDRCGFCHREIVDEGGVFDEDGIYHTACSDHLRLLKDYEEKREFHIRRRYTGQKCGQLRRNEF